MFTLKSRNESHGLDEAIDEVLSELKGTTTDTEEYSKAISHLSTLYKLKETHSRKPVSADTMAIVIGNLLGIVLILHFEKLNVVTSKATTFVMKLK